MQPEDISLIWMPESFRKPPSMLISPNSFSMSTSFSPGNASASSFLIRVVLPAPRKPDTMSIFVIVKPSFLCRVGGDKFVPRLAPVPGGAGGEGMGTFFTYIIAYFFENARGAGKRYAGGCTAGISAVIREDG